MNSAEFATPQMATKLRIMRIMRIIFLLVICIFCAFCCSPPPSKMPEKTRVGVKSGVGKNVLYQG